MRETLDVRPGITSQGSVFYYRFGDKLLDPDRPEENYVANFLLPKIAMKRAYLDRDSLLTDLCIIFRTTQAIVQRTVGYQAIPYQNEIEGALRWVPEECFEKLK